MAHSSIPQPASEVEAVQSAEAYLERVLASINDQFLVLDSEWRYTYVNDRVVETVGMSREDLLGHCIWDIFPDLVGTQFYTEVHRAMATQTTTWFEYYYSPWQRWFENRIYPSNGSVSILVSEITERKRAEESARRSEERLQLALSAAQMFIWDLDYQTQRAVCSEVAQEICGFQEGSSEDFLALTHPEDLESLQQAVQQAIANGVPILMDYRVIAPDGQIRWLRTWGSPHRSLSGQLERMIGVSVDITTRKQAEAEREQLLQELAMERARFEAVLQQMPAGVMIADAASGKLVLTNEQAKQIVGYEHGQPLLDEYEQIANFAGFHADGRLYQSKDYPLMRSLQRGETVFNEEIALHRGNGNQIFMNVNSAPIRDSQGQIVAAVVILQDVTQRKQAEEALRINRERLDLVLESAELGLWYCDLPFSYLNWNDKVKEHFWLPVDADVTLETFYEMMHPDDRQPTQAAIERAITEHSAYAIDYRTVSPDRQVKWIRAIGHAFYDAEGNPNRFDGITIDITEHKQAEVEREQLLKQEQASRAAAERANRVKDEFLAVLSHELRSPLNPILGWSRLLQSRKLDEAKVAHALATIERNAKLQSELITDLLDVSRILQGKLSLSIHPVDLVTTIQSAIETVRLAAESKSIRLQMRLDASIGQVSGDSSRLQQVLWNLLSNAVKFTPEGGQVEVSLLQVKGYAQIQVRDNGKGITPEFLPYVFDYFRQADATTTRKFGGLGLGLAIVRHLVELHGGTVQAESPGEGLGATFTVHLPLLTVASEIVPNSPLVEPSPDLNGLKVLVVDDEADARELVAFLLEQSGAQVMTVASAGEALTALAQFQPNLLLSDIGMPEMDGYTLIQQIRALPPTQGGQIPAIALTAYAGEIDHQRAIASGFQRHISKPIEPEELLNGIASFKSLWNFSIASSPTK